MDDISDTWHSKFKYVLIPEDICEEPKELEFEGYEKDFKQKLNNHFASTGLLKKEREQLSKDFVQGVKDKEVSERLSPELLEHAVEASQTCQIVPITLPTKNNNYDATNAYVDNIGRVKNLGHNSQASRILQDDIRGDCFISRTFDDEETFKRTDFTLEEFRTFLKNPPAKTSYNQQKLLNMVNNPKEAIEQPVESEKRCSGCLSTCKDLKICGGCKNAFYCSSDCQKDDWKYHKAACKKVVPQSA